MSDTFKLAKNLAKDAIGMSPEIEITKIKLPRRGGGLASLREMPVVYRQSGGPTKLMETDMGLQEMFLGGDGNYYTIDGFDERGLYDPRFDQTTDRIAPDWGRDIDRKDIEKALQTNNVLTRGETSPYETFGRLGRGARPSPTFTRGETSPYETFGRLGRGARPSGVGRLGQTLPGRKPPREVTGDASLAEQITKEQAEKEAEARDAGRYGRGVRPSPAGANMLQSPIGFAYPNRSTEIGTISTVPTSDPAYQVEKSRTEYDPNLLIGGNMVQPTPTRAYTPGMFGKPRTTRTLLQSMADFTRQREEREAKQAADREAEERDAGRYGRGARPSPNAFQRAITTLMSGFQQPDKPTTQPTSQGMVYGPISPDQMAMSQAAQIASELELEDAEMGEPARTSMGEGMPSKGSGQLWSPAPDLSYMDTPEYQTEETWESYDPYGDYSVDMGGYYALKHGGGLSGIVKKSNGGDFDYGDFDYGDVYGPSESTTDTYDYDAYSYGPSESISVDAPSVSSDLPDAAYMGDFAFAPDPQGRVGLMGPDEVAGVDIAQTYLSPDPESSELGQYEDVSGLERFFAGLPVIGKTFNLSKDRQRFVSDKELENRYGDRAGLQKDLINLNNKYAFNLSKSNKAIQDKEAEEIEKQGFVSSKREGEIKRDSAVEAAKKTFGEDNFREFKGIDYPAYMPGGGIVALGNFIAKMAGVIGTAEVRGVPVHVKEDGSISVISPEDEPGFDQSKMDLGNEPVPSRKRLPVSTAAATSQDEAETPKTGMAGLLARRSAPASRSESNVFLSRLLDNIYGTDRSKMLG